MTKKEVDKQLGLPDSKDDTLHTYNYQGLDVFYRNNKVAAMSISNQDKGADRFKAINKIGIGDTKEDVIKIHKEGIEFIGALSYYYHENKDKSLLNITEKLRNNQDLITENLHIISYLFSGNGEISMISISDSKYTIGME